MAWEEFEDWEESYDAPLGATEDDGAAEGSCKEIRVHVAISVGVDGRLRFALSVASAEVYEDRSALCTADSTLEVQGDGSMQAARHVQGAWRSFLVREGAAALDAVVRSCETILRLADAAEEEAGDVGGTVAHAAEAAEAEADELRQELEQTRRALQRALAGQEEAVVSRGQAEAAA
eukprot:5829402-Pleurochrysis_carterae.AAC.2